MARALPGTRSYEREMSMNNRRMQTSNGAYGNLNNNFGSTAIGGFDQSGKLLSASLEGKSCQKKLKNGTVRADNTDEVHTSVKTSLTLSWVA